MAYTLTDQDHADIATIEAQLADLDAAIQRHHRTQLTGHDTNPAGDIWARSSRRMRPTPWRCARLQPSGAGPNKD